MKIESNQSNPLMKSTMRQLKHFLIMALLLTLSNNADAGDEVHGMLTPWGKIVDPDRDCVFQTEDDSLSIRFGAGDHALDVEVNRMNAPRVLRSVDGNFSVQVTVDGNLPLPDPSLKLSRAYISGAMVVMQDDRNYIRLERASFTRNGQIWHYANFEQRIDGKRKRMGQFNDFPLPPDGPIQLRLEVLDDQVRGLARRDNDDWHEVGTAQMVDRTTLLVGVSGVKTFEQDAAIHFRELRYSSDDPTIAAYSSSVEPMTEPKIAVTAPSLPVSDPLHFFELARDIQRRSMAISDMTDEDQAELISDARELALKIPKEVSGSLPMTIATGLAQGFQQAQRPTEAIRVYRDFAAALEPVHGSVITQKLLVFADRTEAIAKRIGTSIELHGTLIDGDALDWQKYDGKIVLIDFWASWSASHSDEMQLVKDLYEAYHDRGFEIVGVCVDSQRGPAEAFIEINEIPWANLFSTNAGWEHPMAKRFDVKSVPTAILIDRDGKILSISARGNSLTRLLARTFGPPLTGHEAGTMDSTATSKSQSLSVEASETSEGGDDESQSKH